MTAEYTIKLDIFEGPLDLLLHLIKVNEMEITEISISAITSQYLEYLRLMETLDLEIAGDFLVIAATLLNIKLRSILPEPEVETEEEAEEETDDYLSARALMQRLVEYRKFKEAARDLGGRAERQARIFMREVALPTINQAEADPHVRGDLKLLLDAFARVVQFVQRRGYHEVQNEEYHVEEKIDEMRRRLLVEPRMSLDEIFAACACKLEMIVTLVAILELCRQRELYLSQIDAFGAIEIHGREGRSLPADNVGEAEELGRLEQEILANRTGFVDDEPLPRDEEEALLDRLMAEDAAPRSRPAPPSEVEADEAEEDVDEDEAEDEEENEEFEEDEFEEDEIEEDDEEDAEELEDAAQPPDEDAPVSPARIIELGRDKADDAADGMPNGR